MDTILGSAFAEMQDVGALNEHRAPPLREVEGTIFDLDETPHQCRRRLMLTRGEPLRFFQ